MVFDVGLTVTDEPVPNKVPPQLPEYHVQLAPVPRLPPLTVRVVLPPLQMVVVPVIPVAAAERLLTVTVTLVPPVVLEHGDVPTL